MKRKVVTLVVIITASFTLIASAGSITIKASHFDISIALSV